MHATATDQPSGLTVDTTVSRQPRDSPHTLFLLASNRPPQPISLKRTGTSPFEQPRPDGLLDFAHHNVLGGIFYFNITFQDEN